MKLKNVYEGQKVVVKKRAFKRGYLEFVYEEIPNDLNATVLSISSDTSITIELDFDSDIWAVEPSEIKPKVKPKRYYQYGPDNEGEWFVVERTGKINKETNEFSGIVVLGNCERWEIGHQSPEWDMGQFVEASIHVNKN